MTSGFWAMVTVTNLLFTNSCGQPKLTAKEYNKEKAVKLVSHYLEQRVKQYKPLEFAEFDSVFNSNQEFVAYRITHHYQAANGSNEIREFHINTQISKVLNAEVLDTSNVYLKNGQVRLRRIY